MSATHDAARIAAVLAFWNEAGPERWFGKDGAFDARFRDGFMADHMAAMQQYRAAVADLL